MMKYLDAMRRGAPAIAGVDDDHVTRMLLAAAFFMTALFIVTVPAWLIDPRLIDGVGVWEKPLKFSFSLAVHFLTLALLAQQLPRAVRAGPSLTIAGMAAVAAMLFEQVYIMIQASRARRSHFNFDTNFDIMMYQFMGLGALLLIVVAIVLGVQIARKGDKVRPGLKLGSVLGLLFGSLVTLGFAGYMSMSGSHSVGVHPGAGAVVPFFGWSREVGDLRPAHFVALHMMQTLPLVGYVADRIGAPARLAVLVAAALQIALSAALFFQALGGDPFWPA